MLAYKKWTKIYRWFECIFRMLFVLLYSCLPENGWSFPSIYFVSSENDSDEGNAIHLVRKSTNSTLFFKNLVFGSSLRGFETYHECVLAHLSWKLKWAFLIARCPSSVLLSVRLLQTLTFSSSSPEPLRQFQSNLAQSILGWRGFTFVQIEGPALY